MCFHEYQRHRVLLSPPDLRTLKLHDSLRRGIVQIPVSCIALEVWSFQLHSDSYFITSFVESKQASTLFPGLTQLIKLFLGNYLFPLYFGWVLDVSTSREVSSTVIHYWQELTLLPFPGGGVWFIDARDSWDSIKIPIMLKQYKHPSLLSFAIVTRFIWAAISVQLHT